MNRRNFLKQASSYALLAAGTIAGVSDAFAGTSSTPGVQANNVTDKSKGGNMEQRNLGGLSVSAIGWLLAQKPWIIPIPGTKRIERIKENIGGADIHFTAEELADIRRHLDSIEIIGARYSADQEALTNK